MYPLFFKSFVYPCIDTKKNHHKESSLGFKTASDFKRDGDDEICALGSGVAAVNRELTSTNHNNVTISVSSDCSEDCDEEDE